MIKLIIQFIINRVVSHRKVQTRIMARTLRKPNYKHMESGKKQV